MDSVLKIIIVCTIIFVPKPCKFMSYPSIDQNIHVHVPGACSFMYMYCTKSPSQHVIIKGLLSRQKQQEGMHTYVDAEILNVTKNSTTDQWLS